jgi:hypothetical protein
MGDGDLAWCGNCLQTINLGISIAIIVLTVRIYNFTEDNITILETFDSNHYYNNITGDRETQHIPASLNELVAKNDFELGKYCQCGEEILENICTEEQIISGCYDVSKNKEKSLLRNLDDTEICSEKIQLGGNPDFHKHFDLGFNMVYKMALGILIIYVAVLGVTVLVLFAAFGTICCGECALAILLPFLPVIFIVVLFSGITNLVLFIIMMVNYYKGNTTGEFLDYYNNCMSDSKYKDMHEDLKDTFEKLDDLDSNFTAFVVLNFIGIFVNWLSSCFNKKKQDQ